jgi:hypothetical protein
MLSCAAGALQQRPWGAFVKIEISRVEIVFDAKPFGSADVEQFDRPAEMVARERQLKGWTRSRKLELIHSQNPEMLDYARRTARDPSLRQPPLRMTEGAKAEGAKER